MWRSSERSRSGWDGEFESPFLQRRVCKLQPQRPLMPAGYIYGRIEDAHYARNVEIRSRNNGSSDQTIGCSTVDEFVRLTLDLRGRQHRAWATPLPNAQEQRGAMEAVYG